jgi:hypothetical protein
MTSARAPLPAGAVQHPACGSVWTGLAKAHCAACCRTFSRESAADRHRVGAFGVNRRCVDPASVGLVARETPFGAVWSWPAPGASTDRGAIGWAS